MRDFPVNGRRDAMNEHELQRILRLASGQPEAGEAAARAAGVADSVLARLPVVRFVIPGSSPGGRVLVLAGAAGLATAAVVAWVSNLKPGSAGRPGGGSGGSAAVGSSLSSVPSAAGAAAIVVVPGERAEGSAPGPKLTLFQPREPEYRPAASVP